MISIKLQRRVVKSYKKDIFRLHFKKIARMKELGLGKWIDQGRPAGCYSFVWSEKEENLRIFGLTMSKSFGLRIEYIRKLN